MVGRSERLVIAGAAGQLGGVLAAQAVRAGRDVLAKTSSEWDITDAAATEEIIGTGDVVINCAAYTDVDSAESDEARAYAVNATGPENLAKACARAGAALIHVSTDYVFDGDHADLPDGAQPQPYEPGDKTAPQGVYARSKFAGERAVLAALPDAVVVRSAWVYTGGTGSDFVAIMRRLAAGEGPVDVVDDQTGSPTYVADLAAALLEVADAGVRGRLLHAANGGRGLAVRVGPRGVRGMRHRSAAGAPGQHRTVPPAGGAAGLLRAGRAAVGRSRPDSAASVAQCPGRRVGRGFGPGVGRSTGTLDE